MEGGVSPCLAANVARSRAKRKLSDMAPSNSSDSSELRQGDPVTPKLPSVEVAHNDAHPRNGNWVRASGDTMMGPDHADPDYDTSGEDAMEVNPRADMSPEIITMESLEGGSQQIQRQVDMQESLTEFLRLVRQGYKEDKWFSDIIAFGDSLIKWANQKTINEFKSSLAGLALVGTLNDGSIVSFDINSANSFLTTFYLIKEEATNS